MILVYLFICGFCCLEDFRVLGAPDIVVCNAGILPEPKDLIETSDSDIRRSMDINVLGVFWVILWHGSIEAPVLSCFVDKFV